MTTVPNSPQNSLSKAAVPGGETRHEHIAVNGEPPTGASAGAAVEDSGSGRDSGTDPEFADPVAHARPCVQRHEAVPAGDVAELLAELDELRLELVRFRSGAVAAQLVDLPPSALLSGRQQQVLALVAAGHSNRRIGRELSITEATVKRHLRDVYALLGAVSRIDAVNKAARAGLLSTRPRRSRSTRSPSLLIPVCHRLTSAAAPVDGEPTSRS